MTHWKFTLPIEDILHNEDLGLDTKGDMIAKIIERKIPVWAPQFERPYHADELFSIADEMRDSGKEDDVEWFDSCMNALYDIADVERIWVKTF